MKFIKVQPFPATVPSTGEYLSASYPGPGVYMRGDQLFINNGSTVYTCMGVAGLVSVDDELAQVAKQPAGVSEDTLLRALAINRDASLALELLGRK